MTHRHPVEPIDWSEAAQRLATGAHDDAAWYVSAAHELALPTTRLAVDIGCGGAGMCLALASALSAEAVIIGVDGNPDVLAAARQSLEASEIRPGRIRLVEADLDHDLTRLDELAGADLIWASASVHHLADQQAAIDALAGLLAPGGRLALAEGGLRIRHLPWDLGIGEPGLETRLIGAEDLWFARMRAALPGSVAMPYGWTTALTRAGLSGVGTTTTVIERPLPLSADDRAAVLHALTAHVERATAADALSDADRDTWRRLLDPGDTAWLGHRDDLYSLEARSVHVGLRESAPSEPSASADERSR
ncbi:MAG TPA: methyltransferase [Jiangellaceae bacterium]